MLGWPRRWAATRSRCRAIGDLRPALQRGLRAVNDGQPAVVDVSTAETRELSMAPKARLYDR